MSHRVESHSYFETKYGPQCVQVLEAGSNGVEPLRRRIGVRAWLERFVSRRVAFDKCFYHGNYRCAEYLLAGKDGL